MKILFLIVISVVFIGAGGFFFFSKNGENVEIILPPNEPRIIEGWPDGVFTSPALKETPKELKPKLDTSEWEAYTDEKIGIAFRYPAKTEGFVLNLKPRVMEENSVGPWFYMNEVAWLATLHLVEEIRNDAEGFFVISIFKKDGAYEDVVQKVREFTVSGKTFLSERAIRVGGTFEGVRIATVNKEETSYAIAYVLHRETDPEAERDPAPEQVRYGASAKLTQNFEGRIFIIDIAIDRIEDPAETEEQFTERVLREQQYFDAVVSTFEVL